MFWKRWFEPKPFNEGYLPEVDGHKVFFWEFGNPKGKPVVVTHGGPGGESKVKHINGINLKNFRVILVDQRGCGGSLPFGETKNNTTQDILYDINRLLDFLKIKRKIVFKGSSWSSTIALLFAQQYPDRVDKLILSSIFLPGGDYDKWQYEEVSKLFPDILDEIKSQVKGKGSVEEYYYKMINSAKADEQYKAFKFFGYYESALCSIDPKIEDVEVDAKRVTRFKVYMHYVKHKMFLKEGEMLKNLDRIKHIPTLIVHNRLDLLCPLAGAYELNKKMEKSRLVIVPEFGHGGDKMTKVLTQEVKEFLK